MPVMATTFDDWRDRGRGYYVSIGIGIGIQSILSVEAIN
jgi:hypothetical protein